MIRLFRDPLEWNLHVGPLGLTWFRGSHWQLVRGHDISVRWRSWKIGPVWVTWWRE